VEAERHGFSGSRADQDTGRVHGVVCAGICGNRNEEIGEGDGVFVGSLERFLASDGPEGGASPSPTDSVGIEVWRGSDTSICWRVGVIFNFDKLEDGHGMPCPYGRKGR
jgi:hypothetical protein